MYDGHGLTFHVFSQCYWEPPCAISWNVYNYTHFMAKHVLEVDFVQLQNPNTFHNSDNLIEIKNPSISCLDFFQSLDDKRSRMISD